LKTGNIAFEPSNKYFTGKIIIKRLDEEAVKTITELSDENKWWAKLGEFERVTP
jgi:hypothetical protein